MIVMIIMALPIISYVMPSFSPFIVTFIPSYQMVFGFREIFFSTGKVGFMLPICLILFIENVVLFAITYLTLKVKLMREA